MSTTEITKSGIEIATKIGFTPKEGTLENWPTTGEKFIVSDEIKEFATFLIRKYRTDLTHSNIGYVFKQKASRNGEEVTYGNAKAESDLQKTLHGLDAVIIIGWDEWCALDTDNKLRVMLHELEKLTFDDKTGKLKAQTPSVMQFPLVVQVFGPSSQAEIDFISAYQKFCRDNGGDGKLS
jgi:hypothetical protein